jgi:hypothetical protein
VGNPVVHRPVGNLTVVARKVEMDTVPGVDHMAGMDTVPGVDHMAGMDTVPGVDHMVEMDIVLEAAHMVEMDIVDRVLMVVDIVAEDWRTDLILLEHTKFGRIDLCLLMCCHNHHKTGHSLHFVFRNLCNALLQFVELQEHAHHDHTGYKK